MDANTFIRKWKAVALTERQACQEHFLDLCCLLGHPTPVEIDKTGEAFCFEKGAQKTDGTDGWADVWKRGFFGWEYKKRHADLKGAYTQLLNYRESLENPPLLVVCDTNIFEIHTNFTGTPKRIHRFELRELDQAGQLEILRAVFFDPAKLHPHATRESVTQEAAAHIAEIAQRLRIRGEDPFQVARFLDRVVFCLFAEDGGFFDRKVFTALLEITRRDPNEFRRLLEQLFKAMATGGRFGLDRIPWFNGNLFNDISVPAVEEEDVESIFQASKLDWSAVDPTIFGTLFERGLDPDKRSQLGAHYTDRVDIESLVEPVIMQPLRREWETVRQQAEQVLDKSRAKNGSAPSRRTAHDKAASVIGRFLDRLQSTTVLDPACGSGNFLYIALQKLKDLEKEVIVWATEQKILTFLPLVSPTQLYGIEVNPYAYELAQMTIWIGYLQWARDNGYGINDKPVLVPMHDNFLCRDAVLDQTDPDQAKIPNWPKAEFIIGNPPFLGGKLLRRTLGDKYVDDLFAAWDGEVARESDYCCYWVEKARAQIASGMTRRAGLLATQAVRYGKNRLVIDRVKSTGDIFFAISDREWIVDGANVHISMVGFDNGSETSRKLGADSVSGINPDLTSGTNVTVARSLKENADISFMGDTKGGSFDIDEALALRFLYEPNAHGRPNSDVVLPWCNGENVTERPHDRWIVDFGMDMTKAQAALYQGPFAHVQTVVKPERDKSKSTITEWWLHERPRRDMRCTIEPLLRFPATVRVAKHRIFVWMSMPTLPDSSLFVFARAEDWYFGILHSRIHEVWSRMQASQLREAESGTRYTPTTCFLTYPFPHATSDQLSAIGVAAARLNDLRNSWLNPPEWTSEQMLEFPGSIEGPWARYVTNPDSHGVGLVRYPRVVARDVESAKRLQDRTLTNLYNLKPAWLTDAHERLDQTVFDAYGWTPTMTDEELLASLLELNLKRSG